VNLIFGTLKHTLFTMRDKTPPSSFGSCIYILTKTLSYLDQSKEEKLSSNSLKARGLFMFQIIYSPNIRLISVKKIITS